jgi:hypothetical protein
MSAVARVAVFDALYRRDQVGEATPQGGCPPRGRGHRCGLRRSAEDRPKAGRLALRRGVAKKRKGRKPATPISRLPRPSPYLGRKPTFTRTQFNMVRHMLAHDTANVAQIAKATGVKRQTIYRLKADPAAGEATLAAWGL